MPKPRPAYLPGRYYHFYNRGTNRHSIFRSKQDYLLVIRLMKLYSRALSLTVIAYCLLPNHYHWLIRQDGDLPAGQLPQRVFNRYVKNYNRRVGRSGSLFAGPYQVVQIDQESYLRHLCHYIHGNPVRHGLVSEPGAWPYSNYPDWIGRRAGNLLDPAFVADVFGGPAAYDASLHDYIHHQVKPEASTDPTDPTVTDPSRLLRDLAAAWPDSRR